MSVWVYLNTPSIFNLYRAISSPTPHYFLAISLVNPVQLVIEEGMHKFMHKIPRPGRLRGESCIRELYTQQYIGYRI